MLRGVIYARYSAGPNQTDRSIEGQIDDCQAFARSNSIDIIKVYADRHISGRSTEGRYELERLIADARAHKFDVVICWKVDRLGRDRYDLAKIKATIKRTGVLIKYAKETLPDGPEGIILESLLEGMAEYYSADLSQKVTRGLKNAAKKGQYPAGVLTYGYTKDADKHVIEDPETKDAVITVFRMYAQVPLCHPSSSGLEITALDRQELRETSLVLARYIECWRMRGTTASGLIWMKNWR